MSGNFLQPPNLSLPTSTASATGNPRNKVALKRGYGILDWVKLGNSGVDLAGTKGRLLDVTPQELAKHNKRKDAWMALKGKVYNVTPYMNFHPGGEDELMRGAGIDATQLFNEVHKWVNFESMLQKCLVGRLVESKSIFPKPNFLPLIKLVKGTTEIKASNTDNTDSTLPKLDVPGKTTQFLSAGSTRTPAVTPQTPLPAPKYDWFQTNSLVNLAIYTKWKHITKDRVVIIKEENTVKVLTYIQESVYIVHLDLQHPVEEEFKLKVGSSGGKVDILFTKCEIGKRWNNIGKGLQENSKQISLSDLEIEYINCKLVDKKQLTHDTKLFTISVPDNIYMPIPIGLHVYFRLKSTDIVKPYTPVLPSISLDSNENEGKLLYFFIKIYNNGAFTQELDKLVCGDDIDLSFPQGSLNYDLIIPNTHLVLIGAGTGITPLVKLVIDSLPNKRKVTLLLFNKTEEDIPWREEFDKLQSSHTDYLQVHHILSQSDSTWSGYKGRITKSLLEEFLPDCNDNDRLFSCFCGPTPFTKLCLEIYKDLGYKEYQYHAFLG